MLVSVFIDLRSFHIVRRNSLEAYIDSLFVDVRAFVFFTFTDRSPKI